MVPPNNLLYETDRLWCTITSRDDYSRCRFVGCCRSIVIRNVDCNHNDSGQMESQCNWTSTPFQMRALPPCCAAEDVAPIIPYRVIHEFNHRRNIQRYFDIGDKCPQPTRGPGGDRLQVVGSEDALRPDLGQIHLHLQDDRIIERNAQHSFDPALVRIQGSSNRNSFRWEFPRNIVLIQTFFVHAENIRTQFAENGVTSKISFALPHHMPTNRLSDCNLRVPNRECGAIWLSL